jgi:poly-gamma-glutamate synthesis protein (capsule biosynthesis protein)
MKKIWFTGVVVLLSFRITGNGSIPETVPDNDSADRIKLIFAGDVMGHSVQIKGAWRDGGDTCYNYHPVFQYVKDYISAAAISVANLEVTLAGKPYTGYPQFSSPGEIAAAVKDAGFNVLTTANNHTLDRYRRGLELTIDELDNMAISHTGTFKDSISWKTDYPLIIEKNNFRLAILNYTYGTNGFDVQKPNVVNYIDTLRMAVDLDKARKQCPDYVVACIHWGEEYKNKESGAQQAVAGFLARNGCNLVIGTHPHVIQPFTVIAGCSGDSVPVIYSLGNFVSNQRDRYRNGGILFEVNLAKKNGRTTLESCNYEPVWVHRFPQNGVSVYRLIPVNGFLDNPLAYTIGEADKKLMMQFYDDAGILLPNLPYSGFYRSANVKLRGISIDSVQPSINIKCDVPLPDFIHQGFWQRQ